MEKINIDKSIPCLNKGFVRLVDYMGDDAAIVQAARVSYGKGTKSVNEDRGLIRYLMRHKHTSPFEMVEFKFHVKLPIFVARQWIRHRTANVNELSGRYSEMTDEFYLPELVQIRPQSKDNKQGRSDEPVELEKANEILSKMTLSQTNAYGEYQEYLGDNIARELSRINLPLSTFTEWYWKIDLHNLFHFLRLRLDRHAQYEIRVYGEAIAELIKDIVPSAYSAFEDYILNGNNFSASEIELIKSLINKDEIDNVLSSATLSKRELEEFKLKLDL